MGLHVDIGLGTQTVGSFPGSLSAYQMREG